MARVQLLFRDVRLIDGTGAPSWRGDLAVSDGRVIAMGDLRDTAGDMQVDGRGLALAPGFIDAHCHDDLVVLGTPDIVAKVSQGVTTVVNGNCGFSVAPIPAARGKPPAPLDAFTGGGRYTFETFADYFAALEAQPAAVNSVCLVGHSALRHAVMTKFDRAATGDEIATMTTLLDQALVDGAIGLSTGLFYPPAHAAPTDEVIAICACLAAAGGMYVTHMRDESDGVVDSLHETFAIGRAAGIPVLVSHHKCTGLRNHGRSSETLACIDAARETQTVWLDAYPYVAGSTFLEPHRVADCSKVLITASQPHPEAAGRDLAELAAEWGCDALEAAKRLVPGGAIYFMMDEADVQRILAYEHTMIGSDGIVADRHPHPRAWGTFPRVIGHYARDVGLFSIEEAVRRMTSLTAGRFGLVDRGVLRPGAWADLVLFDPDTIIDIGDFETPARPAAGIVGVWTNGVKVWDGAAATGARPGRVLKRGTGDIAPAPQAA